jgi:hypothetical protein
VYLVDQEVPGWDFIHSIDEATRDIIENIRAKCIEEIDSVNHRYRYLDVTEADLAKFTCPVERVEKLVR